MSWWNRNKKGFLIVSGGLLALIVIAFAFLMISGPLVGDRMCTLVGCVGGLEIELLGLPDATPYEISIVFPSGETQTLTCGTENDQSEVFVKKCSPNGAFFSLTPDAEPPQEITVTVTIAGSQTSETFRPVYEKFQPNGENCSPTCYSATIFMNISQ
jgi:hypothetical protein